MATEIKIAFDGSVPGLADHRLSIKVFGHPMQLLLSALRRTASGLLRDAMGDDYGRHGGRLNRHAERLDLELASVDEGSAIPVFLVSMLAVAGQQIELIDTLPERAAVRLVEDLEAESQGRMRNAAARKYLEALPEPITQTYTVMQDGVCVTEATIGKVELAAARPDLPHLLEVTARVGGVTFEPRPAVKLIAAPGKGLIASATEQLVDTALTLRGLEVSALAVAHGAEARLLRLTDARAEHGPITQDAVEEHLFNRWSDLLQRLAQ